MAVSDTLCLWVTLPKYTYINVFNIDYHNLSYVHCKFVDWLGFSSGTVSTWTIVSLTGERLLLTIYPINAKMRLTPKVSFFISMTTVLVSQLFAVPVIFSRTYLGTALENSANFSSCAFSSKVFETFYRTTWSFITLLWFYVFPVAVIISGNAIIGTTLLKRKKQIYPTSCANQQNLAREKMALKMLFVISFLHVIFASPYAVYLVIKANTTQDLSPKGNANDQLIHVILNMLVSCNFTFNFALYFTRGSLFRQQCKGLLISFKKKKKKDS